LDFVLPQHLPLALPRWHFCPSSLRVETADSKRTDQLNFLFTITIIRDDRSRTPRSSLRTPSWQDSRPSLLFANHETSYAHHGQKHLSRSGIFTVGPIIGGPLSSSFPRGSSFHRFLLQLLFCRNCHLLVSVVLGWTNHVSARSKKFEALITVIEMSCQLTVSWCKSRGQ
jgi:hypothetical protein